MMCRRRFKALYYCRNARIDKGDIPKLFIEAVKRNCADVMEEADVKARLQVKNSYIHDMQDLTIIVDTATVYSDKTVKIKLIDSTEMKLRLQWLFTRELSKYQKEEGRKNMGQKIYFNFVNVRKYLKRQLCLPRIGMPCRWNAIWN